jgi:hypothetical protein
VPVCGGLGRRGCGNFDRSMKIIDPWNVTHYRI